MMMEANENTHQITIKWRVRSVALKEVVVSQNKFPHIGTPPKVLNTSYAVYNPRCDGLRTFPGANENGARVTSSHKFLVRQNR